MSMLNNMAKNMNIGKPGTADATKWKSKNNQVVISIDNQEKTKKNTTNYTPAVSAVIPESINKITDAAEKTAVIEIDQKLTAANATCQNGFVSQIEYVGKIWNRFVFTGMVNANGQIVKGYLTVMHQTPQEFSCEIMDEQHFMWFNRCINPSQLQSNLIDLDLINWAEEKLHDGIKKFESQLTGQFWPMASYEQYVQIMAPGYENTKHIINIYRDRQHVEYGGYMPLVNITLPEGTDENKIGVESEYFDQTSFQGIDPNVAQLIYHNVKMINMSEQLKVILNCFKLKGKFKVFNESFIADCENGDMVQITINASSDGPIAQVVNWKKFDLCTCKHDAA